MGASVSDRNSLRNPHVIAGRRVRTVAAALTVALLASGCDAGGDPDGAAALRSPIGRPTTSEALIIGLVGTMTGPDAWRGEDAFEGADLAVHELNEALGDEATPYQLVTLDDGGDPARALNLIQDLAALDRTVGILYAGPPSALAHAEDALAEGAIPAVLLYGDLYAAQRLTSHVFQASSSFLWEARRMAAYIADDRGYKRVGVVAERSLSGRTAVRSMRESLRAARLARPVVVRHDGGRSLRAKLSKLRRRGTEAVAIEGGAAVLAQVASALERMGAAYRDTDAARLASAPRKVRRRRVRANHWRPQLMAFHLAFTRRPDLDLRPGTIVAASYSRGSYYLPVASFKRFRAAYEDWWGEGRPLGWQQQAYDGAHMVGWAVKHARGGQDLARSLENLQSRRFGGLDVTFGPDDHTAVDQIAVGLWVVPRRGAAVRERGSLPQGLPWVPLSRGFAIDGRDTDIDSQDWRYLIRNSPRPGGPPPSFRRLKFGVTTGRHDPVH
jgi:ABC-type branched-subunit amino acid transport system substrate-binding protein